MASARQIEANQRNAKNSTGPKTAPGKAAAAMNALKHGLLARDELIGDESAKDFARFTKNLHEQLKPEGELESALVGRIVTLLWRLRRISTFEAGILAWQEAEMDSEIQAIFIRKSSYPYMARRGDAYIRSADSLAKLSRYETSIERSLSKTLHEFQRLQAARQGEPVSSPVVIDVDVNGTSDTSGI